MSLPARKTTTRNIEIRSLSSEELDRRLEALTASVLGLGQPGPRHLRSDEDCGPRLISTAELVRRMRPFIVYN